MATFKKGGNKEVPAISTASLPDIVFMLLFFFMVSTTMREVELMVDSTKLPSASEVTKLEKKKLTSNIYIGVPRSQYMSLYGSEPRIQLNDRIASLADIPAFVEAEKESRAENERNLIINNIKAHSNTKMGLITDLKQELRKVHSYRISYASVKTGAAKK